MQPQVPQAPEALPQFRGMDPDTAVQQAQADAAEFAELLEKRKKPSPILWILGLILTAVGAAWFVLRGQWFVLAPGAVLTVLGVILQVSQSSKNKHLETQMQSLTRWYAPLLPDQWAAEAERYARSQEDYEASMAEYRNRVRYLETGLKDILNRQEEMTGGLSPLRFEQEAEAALQQHRAYAEARRERSRLEDMVSAFESSHREIQPPKAPDELTFTGPETDRLLSDVTAEIRQLHVRAGQYQGRMEALGDPGVLRQQLAVVTQRIEELEKIHGAALLAQQTLEAAKLELQRRFAPRISQRAQEIFSQLTGGRYQRLALDQNLGVSAATEDEDTLRGALWRSDGTADQLYLALRLAVAEELTPQAPLVLDDAFVRFDDDRLKEILKLMNQTGEEKQVIVFTCQSRERTIMEELS